MGTLYRKDIPGWTGKALGGIPDLIEAETQPEGFVAADSIESWAQLGRYLYRDFKYVRAAIKQRVATATSNYSNIGALSSVETEIACRFVLVPESVIFANFPQEGLEILTAWSALSQESRAQRYEHAKISVFMALQKADAMALLLEAQQMGLITSYIDGLEEKAFDFVDGIFDWIEGTLGTGFETTGVNSKPYTPLSLPDMQAVSDLLSSIFRDGDFFLSEIYEQPWF